MAFTSGLNFLATILLFLALHLAAFTFILCRLFTLPQKYEAEK
jgi:hypothetical protein